jgi:probable aminopeptidase NPEPL1
VIDIRYATKVSAALRGAEVVVVVAPKSALDEGYHRTALGTDWAAALDRPVEDTKPGDNGVPCGTYGPDGGPRRLAAVVLPDSVSRHNAPCRSEAIFANIAKTGIAGKKAAVVVRLDSEDHLTGAAVAITRAFPVFSDRSGGNGKAGRITVAFTLGDGTPVKVSKAVKETTAAVQLAAELVDTPPQEMTTAGFEKAARAAVKGIKGMRVTSIVGDKLVQKKLGGIHGVGRTAVVPPRLLILDYKPTRKPRRTVALVGKGIVYDTGGLSLKVGGSMPNMKCDMGGAAATFGAFLSLVKGGTKDRVVFLGCLAENAIGPHSYRPDDILHMHSGKTVEINNTDAEGRLVLGDGVSWAARVIKADVIIDAATLTGAALIATGKEVSCTVSNRAGLESLSVECGRATGDLTHPLLFAPEIMRKLLKSKVADMKNSVSDRMSAQTSAAGQFIYSHIEDTNTPWLHLDIAGPAFRDGRGTGHGAALIAEVVRNLTDDHLAE